MTPHEAQIFCAGCFTVTGLGRAWAKPSMWLLLCLLMNLHPQMATLCFCWRPLRLWVGLSVVMAIAYVADNMILLVMFMAILKWCCALGHRLPAWVGPTGSARRQLLRGRLQHRMGA